MELKSRYLPEIDELIEFYCSQRKRLAAGPAKARVLSKIYLKHRDSDAQKIIRAIIIYTTAYSRVARFFARPIFAAPFLLSALVFSGGGFFLMLYLQEPRFAFAVAAGLVASHQAICRYMRTSIRYNVEAAFCDELREGLMEE